MKQKEAIILALSELGGRAKLEDIYPRAMKHADFSGSNDPKATIRWWLQDLRQKGEARQSPNLRGYWELISYQEEIASLRSQTDALKAELESMQQQLQQVNAELIQSQQLDTCYERLSDALIEKMAPCDKEDRKEVRDALTKIQNWLVLHPSEDIAERINNFVYGKPKPLSVKHVNPLPPTKYPFVCNPQYEDAVVARLIEYLQGKTSPKDIMMPFRAAQDAGVIFRITYEQMQASFPDYCPGKTSVNDYTNPDKTPYFGKAYDNMVNDFKAIAN